MMLSGEDSYLADDQVPLPFVIDMGQTYEAAGKSLRLHKTQTAKSTFDAGQLPWKMPADGIQFYSPVDFNTLPVDCMGNLHAVF